ncbi:MAG: hypothetical protein KGO53_09805 [Alphaproteobacteria bacterium]|nr:hypothetical protein [Alphaproteobacteria bacterium]
MFKFAGVFACLVSGAASAAETAPLCTAAPSNAQQVTVQGDYQGQTYAFTVTIDGKAAPGFDAPPAKAADAKNLPCALTS